MFCHWFWCNVLILSLASNTEFSEVVKTGQSKGTAVDYIYESTTFVKEKLGTHFIMHENCILVISFIQCIVKFYRYINI